MLIVGYRAYDPAGGFGIPVLAPGPITVILTTTDVGRRDLGKSNVLALCSPQEKYNRDGPGVLGTGWRIKFGLVPPYTIDNCEEVGGADGEQL